MGSQIGTIDESPSTAAERWAIHLAERPQPRLQGAQGIELVAAIVEWLEVPIRDGSLREQDRLPPERLLSKQLGVSRATVREALHELELKGLVARRQGSGTSVAVSEARHGELGRQLMGGLDSQQRGVAEIMDFREATEVPIAARAATVRDGCRRRSTREALRQDGERGFG